MKTPCLLFHPRKIIHGSIPSPHNECNEHQRRYRFLVAPTYAGRKDFSSVCDGLVANTHYPTRWLYCSAPQGTIWMSNCFSIPEDLSYCTKIFLISHGHHRPLTGQMGRAAKAMLAVSRLLVSHAAHLWEPASTENCFFGRDKKLRESQRPKQLIFH